MGGLGGHMQAPWERLSLSFNDIKDIFSKAASGKLEGTVKLDGINLLLSYNIQQKTAIAARNKGDLLSGQTTADVLSKKYADKPNIAKQFSEAIQGFTSACQQMNDKDLRYLFGDNVNIFYNCELINPENPNVIKYELKGVVVHHTGHTRVDREKSILEAFADSKRVNFLDFQLQLVDQKNSDYPVKMDAIKNLKELSNKDFLQEIARRLDKEIDKIGVTPEQTLADYVKKRVTRILEVKYTAIPEQARKYIAARLSGQKITARDIYAAAGSEGLAEAKVVLSQEKKLASYAIQPIELIIHDFAVEVLKTLQSAFILDSRKEVERHKNELAKAIEAIQNSDDLEAMSMLQQQMLKLKSIDNVYTADEGFVFQYKDKLYKFTGNFAPINQILGLFKYGRGNIKLGEEATEEDGEKKRTIALVPGAFKPPHAGHLSMVQYYANIADKVVVFMSPLPRKMPNNGEILYAQAKQLWDIYLTAYDLNNKVEVLEAPVNSPIQASIQFLANKNNDPEWAQPGDVVVLGASLKNAGEDLEKIGNVDKYIRQGVALADARDYAAPSLKDSKTGAELSATDMREAIANNDVEALKQFVPEKVQNQVEQIMKILSPKAKLAEAALPFFLKSKLQLRENDDDEKSIELKYGLHIPREDMPQIKNEASFKQFLDQANIGYEELEIPARDIKYTQKQIFPGVVKDLQKRKGREWLKSGDNAVVISRDNFLVDGHHRVYALRDIDPDETIEVLRVDLPIGQLIKIVKKKVKDVQYSQRTKEE